jgi:ankyrin repeat protein
MGAGIDAYLRNGRTSLHWAALSGWADVIEKLLAQRANPDVPAADDRRETAIMMALTNGYPDCVEPLIRGGIWFRIRQHDSRRTPAYPRAPLHFAGSIG